MAPGRATASQQQLHKGDEEKPFCQQSDNAQDLCFFFLIICFLDHMYHSPSFVLETFAPKMLVCERYAITIVQGNKLTF